MVGALIANTVVDALQGPGARRLTGGTSLTAPFSLTRWEEMGREFYARVGGETARGNDMRASAQVVEMHKKEKMTGVPFGATAYSNRGMYFDCMVLTCWLDPVKDDEVRELEPRAGTEDQKQELHWRDWRGWVVQYYFSDAVDMKEGFKGRAKRLVELKRKYDPESRFSSRPWKIVVT